MRFLALFRITLFKQPHLFNLKPIIMKLLKIYFTLSLIFLCLFSCTYENEFEIFDNTNIQTKNQSIPPSTQTSYDNLLKTDMQVVFSSRKLIVQYIPNTTEAQKSDMRYKYKVQTFLECSHCDETIELWDFGSNFTDIDLENKVTKVKGDRDGGVDVESYILRVEKEFEINQNADVVTLNGGSENTNYTSKVKMTNSGVTIAVIDSGVDVNYPTFGSSDFLYNEESIDFQSGWNYTYNADNCYDDFELVHGTAVSNIIFSTLNTKAIPFQILPVKITDDFGKTSKFDMVCAFSLVLDKVDIVQFSLGWYGDASDEEFNDDIIKNLIETHQNDVLVITSAGNRGFDNDGSVIHFPKAYNLPNIISVAAANETLTSISDFSNYGDTSVDFIASGTNISFINSDLENVYISGTSFATPIVSAMAAKVFYDSGMIFLPTQIITELINESSELIDLEKPTKYNALISSY